MKGLIQSTDGVNLDIESYFSNEISFKSFMNQVSCKSLSNWFKWRFFTKTALVKKKYQMNNYDINNIYKVM